MIKQASLTILVIALLVFVNLPIPVLADENDDTIEKCVVLETFVVTATKTKKKIERVSASVDVISSVEIEKMGAMTLKDVIEKTSGLTMQYGRFPHPSSISKSSISIRGMGGNATLILLDGKRLGAESESPYEMDRIPADMIERIEIIKGPMSTLYGSDALGGVINIITKKPTSEKINISLNLRGGINDSGDGEEYTSSFNLRGTAGKLGYTMFANYNESKPYTEREKYSSQALNPMTNQPIVTDDQHGKTGDIEPTYRDEAEIFTTGLSLGYDFTDALNAVVDLHYFQEDREGFYRGFAVKPRPGLMPPAAMVLDTPVKFVDDNKRLDYSLLITHHFSDKFTSKFRVYRSEFEKRNRTIAFNFTAPPNKKACADVDITAYEIESIWAVTEDHQLVGGAEHRILSRDTSLINPVPSSFEFLNDTQRFNAFYIQDEWQITDTMNAILGMRYDDISYIDNEVSFKAGLVKEFIPMLRLRLNYAEGYRAPDAGELYFMVPMPGDVPRVGAEAIFGPKKTMHTLKPESVKTYELGIGGENDRFSYSAALFFNDVKDKISIERIDVTHDGVDDYQTYVNKTNVEIQGIEIEAVYNFGYGISLSCNWQELDTKDKKTGKDLLFNPERTASLGLDYQITDTFSTFLAGRYIGRQYITESKKSDDFTIVDISFTKKMGTENRYQIYGGINNLFGEDMDKVLGSNVGPFFYAGLRIHY